MLEALPLDLHGKVNHNQQGQGKLHNFETLKFETSNRISKITLNRPDAANGLNNLMSRELCEAAQICDADTSIKAVILTANGKFFCAGGDLKAMAGFQDDIARQIKILANDLHMAISTFSRMEHPLIIAVNGMAAGAGFSLAATGDYVIAGAGAAFTMAYTKAGLSPDGSSSYFLPRLIGLRRTQDLMLTNRMLSATEAQEWGVVSEVAEDDALQDRAMEIAQMFTEGSSAAHGVVKKLLLGTFNNSLETQMEIEGRFITECASSSDGKEGIAAFAERRKPSFM